MSETYNNITVRLQSALNKRMYNAGKISYDTYSKANEILHGKLTNEGWHDKIIHSEMK